jgi:hypothetical protein
MPTSFMLMMAAWTSPNTILFVSKKTTLSSVGRKRPFEQSSGRVPISVNLRNLFGALLGVLVYRLIGRH